VAVHYLVDGIVEQTAKRHTEFAVARPKPSHFVPQDPLMAPSTTCVSLVFTADNGALTRLCSSPSVPTVSVSHEQHT
jgi:hypothetical protein